jgi:hypothetical protein
LPYLQDLLARDAALGPAIAAVLGEMGPAARSAAPALARNLKDERVGMRAEAAWALWRIERHSAAIPTLIACLRATDLAKGREAGFSPPIPIRKFPDGSYADGGNRLLRSPCDLIAKLAELGPLARPAIPALEQIVADEWGFGIYGEAAWALWKIDRHKAAVPALARCVCYASKTGPAGVIPVGFVDGGHGRVNRAMLARLEEIGPDARPAIPTLLKLYQDADEDRPALLRALRKIDPEVAKGLEK